MTDDLVFVEGSGRKAIDPCVFVPWPSALPYPAKILPGIIGIAQRGAAFIHQDEYARVDVARNQAAKALLESRFSHVLMLDSDQAHPPDILQRLLKWVIEDPERLVIGALYFRRSAPYDPLCYIRGEDGAYYVPTEWEQGLLERDMLGTGAMLISRKVFEMIPEPWFYYDYSHVDIGGYPSEDVGFCKSVRAAGIKIYVDTTIVSPHMRPAFVGEHTFRTYLEMQKEQGHVEVHR